MSAAPRPRPRPCPATCPSPASTTPSSPRTSSPPLTTVAHRRLRVGPRPRRTRPDGGRSRARSADNAGLPPPQLVVRASTAPPRTDPAHRSTPKRRSDETHRHRSRTARHRPRRHRLRRRRRRRRALAEADAASQGPDQDLATRTTPRSSPGARRWSAAWNATAPRREGHRAGDPRRQDLRGGHRRRDHRGQRAVPGLQHRAGGGAAVPEAGRAGRARRLPRRHGVHRGPHR